MLHLFININITSLLKLQNQNVVLRLYFLPQGMQTTELVSNIRRYFVIMIRKARRSPGLRDERHFSVQSPVVGMLQNTTTRSRVCATLKQIYFLLINLHGCGDRVKLITAHFARLKDNLLFLLQSYTLSNSLSTFHGLDRFHIVWNSAPPQGDR